MDESLPLAAALFGEDHDRPSEYAMCSVGVSRLSRAATACAISVGGIAALARKGGTAIPNEDCLYAYDDGILAVHILADGHHGHEASHDMVEALSAAYDEMGPELDPEEALELVQRYLPVTVGSGAKEDDDTAQPKSRTTLLILSMNRQEQRLRGVSIGDSAIFLGSLESGVRRVVAPTQYYAAPWDYRTMGAHLAQLFDVPISQGDWVISCTDGVTECNYGNPDASIQSSDLEALMIKAGGVPDQFVESVAALALTGVNGNAGGEDNLAVIASVV